ncbi:hypothetical protein JCM24511_08389 [Saitozyma sp. JCM 24511]|nr:hypothetical protein JCM24511_08389 [Saitozyma sp. JCM 24511]
MSSTATPQDEQSLVDRLKELGIPEKSARYALKKTNNDVERAANYVVAEYQIFITFGLLLHTFSIAMFNLSAPFAPAVLPKWSGLG